MMERFPLKKFIEYNADGEPISLYIAVGNLLMKRLFEEKTISMIEYDSEISLLCIILPYEKRPIIRVISINGGHTNEVKRVEKTQNLFTSYSISEDKLLKWLELL